MMQNCIGKTVKICSQRATIFLEEREGKVTQINLHHIFLSPEHDH
jgi:hypothetical protein